MCGDFFSENYQPLAMRTANPDRIDVVTAALGLSGETGEVVDIIKKHWAQGHPLDKEAIMNELGDVVWYVALMCEALNLKFSDVLSQNILKLQRRYPDGFDPEQSINRSEDHADPDKKNDGLPFFVSDFNTNKNFKRAQNIISSMIGNANIAIRVFKDVDGRYIIDPELPEIYITHSTVRPNDSVDSVLDRTVGVFIVNPDIMMYDDIEDIINDSIV